ncbi:kinase-like domain-containing protein [Phlyctochytrium arcticum]|nr:kinase-like domain-containing protein [Phlyctochytrium arcticum]
MLSGRRDPDRPPFTNNPKTTDKTPKQWWNFIGDERDRGAKRDVLLRMYKECTGLLSAETYRNDPYLAELWSDYLQLLSEASMNHQKVRELFKYLESARIGTGYAKMYQTWADFELNAGFIKHARQALLKGISQNALPIDDLRAALNELSKLDVTESEQGSSVGGMAGVSVTSASSSRRDSGNERTQEIPTRSEAGKAVGDASLTSSAPSPSSSTNMSPDGLPTGLARTNPLAGRIGKLGPPARVSRPKSPLEERWVKVEEMDDGDDEDMSIDSEPDAGVTVQRMPPPIKPEEKRKVLAEKEPVRSTRVSPPTNRNPPESVERAPPRLPTQLTRSRTMESVSSTTPSVPLSSLHVRTTSNNLRHLNVTNENVQPATPTITPQAFMQRTLSQPTPTPTSSTNPGLSALRRSTNFSAFPPSQLHTPLAPPVTSHSNKESKPSVAPSIPTKEGSPIMNWNAAIKWEPPPDSGKSTFKVNGIVYQKLEKIGRGGSSKVYKIVAPDGKFYALKRVKLHGQEESCVEGYLNEIELLRRLEGNDRIIRLIGSELDHKEGILLMVLEYGEMDLAHILQKEKGTVKSIEFVRTYWEQMLRAVHAIHEQNIIHSDLKPANFLMVGSALKLIDFGIAKSIPNDTTNIRRDYQTGTINYMAPEAIEFVEMQGGQQPQHYVKLGRSSDIWSLGCILYQFIYGNPPFAAHPPSQKLHYIVNPKHMIKFEPADPLAIQVMKSCLQRDPKQRMTIPELLRHPFSVSSVPVSRSVLMDILKQVTTLQAASHTVDLGAVSALVYTQLVKGEKVDLNNRRPPD